MKKAVFMLFLLLISVQADSSLWRNELDIHKGPMNELSPETSKYFCETENSHELEKEMLEFFKNQDNTFYLQHKESIDRLPAQLINSTKKENAMCPNGWKPIGECGNIICVRN